MTWFRNPGMLEYLLAGLFILFYVAYIVRIYLISQKLKSTFKSIFYKFFLRTGYFLLLLIALLGPSFGNVKKEVKSVSREIFLVIDISLSMDAQDVLPSRLEKTKQELKNLVKSLSSDRIGIIAFSASSFVHCPPTYDQSALNLFIETLSTNLSSVQGSNMTSAIQLAVEKFSTEKKNYNNKVIVLVTDGEDFSKNSESLTSDIKAKNVHLFVLGTGTVSGSKIPFNGSYKKDRENKEIITRLNDSFLKEFAEKANGSYFELSEFRNETDYLGNEIRKVEGFVSDTREVDASANKYLYFLSLGFILIIIDVLITVRTVKIT